MANNRGIRAPERESGSSPSTSTGFGPKMRQENHGDCGETASSPESCGFRTPQSGFSPFLFINTHERNGKQKSESRMLVRSHVMSTFYRKKTFPHSHEETTPRDVEVGGHSSKFRFESYPQRRKTRRRRKIGGNAGEKFKNENSEPTMSIPFDSLGAGLLDPFSVAALPWNDHMQRLVQHYVADVPDSIHPLKYSSYHVQNFILKMAITDEALLHAILAYAMIHKFCFGTSTLPSDFEKTEYATSNSDVLGHQTQAIHLVNQKLSSGEVDDVTIATVLLLLWHHPWMQGAGEHEALVHFKGLRQMIQCRGGLENLPQPLSNSINFHGLKRSMLTGAKPQPPISIITPVSLEEIAVPLKYSESIFSRSPTYLAPLLGTELWQILLDLNQFTAFVSYFRSHQNEFGPGKGVSFEHWNAALEYRLLSYSPPSNGINICDNNFKEALRLAAVLWISTGLWTFPLSTSLVRSTAGYLVDVLVGSDLELWRERFPDMLLWILVIVGCCTPVEDSRKTFLLGHLKFIAGLRRYESKEDLVKALESFIYMDGAYATPLATLWRDIAEEGLGEQRYKI